MNLDILLFIIFPYISFAIAITVTIYRLILRPFSVSSMSSQLLERKQLYWGSISFHWGIILVLLGHLLALLLPGGLLLWNTIPIRQYLVELTGLGLGIWALVGLFILLWRRLSVSRIRVLTTPMDLIVLILVIVSALSGVLVATLYRFGTSWFALIFAPYLVSVFTFQPDVTLVAPLPWLIKLHVINFFILLAVLPFSRLIHMVAYPFTYIGRPWQIVIWNRKPRIAGKRSEGEVL